MGIDILKLSGTGPEVESELKTEDLAQPRFNSYLVQKPLMSIWVKTTSPGKPVLPWWRYESAIDEDIQSLYTMWNVSTAQNLYDFLFLSELKKTMGTNLYCVVPGNVKTEGWGKLQSEDKKLISNGIPCQYHLEAQFQKQVNINWVPFYSPQVIIKNPPFGSLWRIFIAGKTDEDTHTMCFFGLKDGKKINEVVTLLTEREEKRSEKMADIADWFGVYSTPLKPQFGTLAAIYTRRKEFLPQFEEIKKNFLTNLQEAQKNLLADPRPRSALKVMSRQVAM